jgi:hypothetical protein
VLNLAELSRQLERELASAKAYIAQLTKLDHLRLRGTMVEAGDAEDGIAYVRFRTTRNELANLKELPLYREAEIIIRPY